MKKEKLLFQNLKYKNKEQEKTNWIPIEKLLDIISPNFKYLGNITNFSFATEIPVSNYFCNTCNGTGLVKIKLIEKLWLCFWNRLPLKVCCEEKRCKCVYYNYIEEQL